MTNQLIQSDRLGDEGSPTGSIILNRGDPAYSAARGHAATVREAEAIFANLVGYLLFAETVILPSRYVLDGAVMAQVAYWARPLLELGLVVPERRGGADSFADVARLRNVPEAGMRRADFLDETAKSVRTFKFDALSATYVRQLAEDLAPNGAFRKVIVGAQRGRNVAALDQASRLYTENRENLTPEDFRSAVASVEPALGRVAMQWAMARYYSTPILFDRANTREVPEAAASLLARAGALDKGAPRYEDAAPVEYADKRLQQLRQTLPNLNISSHHDLYCEALIAVREREPWARRLFSEIRNDSALRDASATLSVELKTELLRQLGVRRESGRGFVVTTALAGGVLGWAGGLVAGADVELQLAAALATSVAAGFATKRLEPVVEGLRGRHDAPWILAVDTMEAQLKV